MSKTDIAFTAALCLVVGGVALVYLPAAAMVAGVALGVAAWFLDRAGDKP